MLIFLRKGTRGSTDYSSLELSVEYARLLGKHGAEDATPNSAWKTVQQSCVLVTYSLPSTEISLRYSWVFVLPNAMQILTHFHARWGGGCTCSAPSYPKSLAYAQLPTT